MGKSSSKPKVTQQERALAERGAREFNDYLQRYVPAEDAFLDATAVSDQAVGAQQGMAHADAAMAHAQYRNTGERPGSGRSNLHVADAARGLGEASGLGQAVAEQGVHDRDLAGRMKMTAFGRGLSDQSSVGLRDSGQRASDAALSASQRRVENRASLLSTGATMAGFGTAKFLDRKDDGNRLGGLFGMGG